MRAGRIAYLFALLPALASAATPQPSNAWKQCSTDEDCVSVPGICRPAAVNSAFVTDAKLYYAAELKKTKCQNEFWHPANPIPRCRLEQCEMVQKDKS